MSNIQRKFVCDECDFNCFYFVEHHNDSQNNQKYDDYERCHGTLTEYLSRADVEKEIENLRWRIKQLDGLYVDAELQSLLNALNGGGK